MMMRSSNPIPSLKRDKEGCHAHAFSGLNIKMKGMTRSLFEGRIVVSRHKRLRKRSLSMRRRGTGRGRSSLVFQAFCRSWFTSPCLPPLHVGRMLLALWQNATEVFLHRRSAHLPGQRSFYKAVPVAGLLLAFSLTGCAPDIAETDFYSLHPEEEAEAVIQTLGTQTVGDVELTLLARTQPYTGYNRFLLQAMQAGQALDEATIRLVPTRDGQTVPLETPASVQADADGYLEAGAFFLQPKGTEQTWNVGVELEAPGMSVEAAFTVTVRDSLWMQTVVDPQSETTYYISWVQPARPTTGEDVLEIAIHQTTDSGFVPVENARLDLYPYMDMGGGEGHSTPYDAPTHEARGFYRGTINFIMAGGWDLTLFLEQSQGERDAVVFKGFTVY